MKAEQKNKLIFIVGPTASGKTALAIQLAKKFNGEVISADSRQVYRGMDIGTDKPKGYFKNGAYIIKSVPHHMINIVEPNDEFTLGHWIKLTQKAISEIQKRNHIPIIAGGTGLYVSALLYGFDVPEVPPNEKLRKKLEMEIKKYGTEHLAKKILKKDPEAKDFLDIKNPRRLIRAWEVMEKTGKKFSQTRKRSTQPKYNALVIGLNISKHNLERKIPLRLKNQFRKGLGKEIFTLSRKYGWEPSMDTLGYSQWKPYIRERINKKTEKIIFDAIVQDTIRYSKRQMTWFKKMPEIKWLDVTNKKRLEKQAAKQVCKFL